MFDKDNKKLQRKLKMSKISGKNHPKFIDLTDKIIGKLTVLDYVTNPNKGSTNWVWKCKCECDQICFVRTNCLTKQNPQSSCKKCADQQSSQKRILEDFGALRNRIFRNYKRAAINRGYSFELTYEQVQKLIEQNCHYCNSEPKEYSSDQAYKFQDSKFKRNGIDRKDNTKGYSLINSVPCCSLCNVMKMDLPYEDFISQINVIYKYYIEKSSTTIEKVSD